MKDLGKWQIISFISRGMSMVVGIVQSFAIIRILTVSEWGLVQLAVSIGGALGIYQHLGLASASTREISAAKEDSEVFKIFVTSLFIRYLVTLPIALLLFIFSRNIAVDVYHRTELIVPLQIYAISLVFQGVQSITNSVISGTKRFKQLFTYQVLISFASLIIYIPLIYKFRINGYFYAFMIFNILNSGILAYLALSPLKAHIKLPSKTDIKRLVREIFSISIGIYIVKILTTNWEKLGPNLLGLNNAPEVIAIFSFAVLYSRKILSISDSVTDVSLPVLSEKFATNVHEFKTTFVKNFDKVFALIILAATYAAFWAPEIIGLVVGSEKYAGSYKLIPTILLAFVVYSLLDIVKSSILIPAKLIRHMLFSFFLLFLSTAVSFLVLNTKLGYLNAMSAGMAAGALIALMYQIVMVKKSLNFYFFNIDHAVLLVQSTVIGWAGIQSSLTVKSIAFLPLLFLSVWSAKIPGYIAMDDLLILKKFLRRKNV
ncbi:hypothetical protein A2415_00625 [candidate division WWE3 bacterium RIFOXYC1_FULL_39_7]|uniref:Polysaccharide biosynthesis protein C-terminal domain-containing protein n=1 Tax=candidate division WWE3 bacterium RIFOXYC1_FULL_39_7 TaxID=1802643 RepID=A0A1F4WL58_UNCKA|nr:MAG: hypothetical protein A2415_00625 [candidate division WWE3 bacterium RIFOXYC1_FULL_39_7]